MRTNLLPLGLLASLAFSFAAWLEPWHASWAGNRGKSANLLQTALGDGRKLFARHVYSKADAYFHNGYYPSIFDPTNDAKAGRLSQTAGLSKDEHDCGDDHIGKPRDWIDAFSRHFYPSRHTHIGEGRCGHEHNHDSHEGCDHCEHCERAQSDKQSGDEREILPWLRLSAELDPESVQTYVVCSYWLRGALKKVDEAEQFLRMGLRANPGDYELLFELGRIYAEDRNDPSRARNLWELGLKNWREREAGKAEPNVFLCAQLLGQLAMLEEKQGRYARALEHLTALKSISPNKATIQQWIDEIRYEHAP
jgi:tetratricopeptide (TPR) repeat protein